MAEHYEVGDIVKLKKPHTVRQQRVGNPACRRRFPSQMHRLRHQIMVARKLVEKNTRGLRKKDA